MRAVAVVAMLLLAAASCGGDDGGATGDTARPDSPVATTRGVGADPTGTSPGAPAGGETVTIERVLDGDSLAVARGGTDTEVRLAGINAPEADECHGDDSRQLLGELAGDEVVLVAVPGEDDRDQFGRLLRNVWSGDTWLNQAMVDAGAALAIQAGSVDEAVLVAAEDRAWEEGLGLWGRAVCGTFPVGPRISDIRYDPPGRDFENTVEEFVLVANDGDGTVDLSGWILRDESSTHRFVFPAGTEVAAGDGLRIRSGCGENQGRDLYWCADDAVWSNGGDTAILQTPTGTVVDRLKYSGDY